MKIDIDDLTKEERTFLKSIGLLCLSKEAEESLASYRQYKSQLNGQNPKEEENKEYEEGW